MQVIVTKIMTACAYVMPRFQDTFYFLRKALGRVGNLFSAQN